MIRIPPNVSSNELITRPNSAWFFELFLRNERPITPIIKAVMGKNNNIYKVSLADNTTKAIIKIKIFKGWKYNASRDTIKANSISLISLLIREIRSPLRSLLKKAIGKSKHF